jgi:hypothetical protein
MNQSDVYKRAAAQSTWVQAGQGLPPGSLPSDLVADSAGNVWAAITGVGVYKLGAGTSTWLAVSTGLTQLEVTSLAVIGNDLYAGIQFGGTFLLANPAGGNTVWVPWSGGDMGAQDAVYGFALGANNVVYAAGYGVVYAAPAGSAAWMRVGVGIEAVGPNYAIVYSSASGALTIGNGSGVYVLPSGGVSWERSIAGMGAATIYGLVVAGGDLYAATFGQGVQRLAAGTATWTEIDPLNSYPVVGAIAIDSQGTIFATPGGAVKKLVNGVWTVAGTGQNSFAHSLTIDAANNVWAGMNGSVRRLAPGATSWTNSGAGLPSNRSIVAVGVDGSGNAFAGIFGAGVYVLPAGTATWTQNVAGLDDMNVHVLQRDPSGAMHVGTDNGVYRFTGGAWQKLGSATEMQFVTALAFDPDGNIYAGTDNRYAWLLPPGAPTWIQVPLGLTSRTVQSLAFGNGRVYAGTDASRGAPSGAFVLALTDTIVEFYNSILDHYFITASAAEQQAILGGSAGPGWSTTGAVFSAGGASLVCRFYGSISPGPNSHFYTIDPNECQQLKDLQQTTPPTEKRWNFESNDFASTSPAGGGCPADKVAVYRAYNNGFIRGIDSNHRITSSYSGYLQAVARGWAGEGTVMCAPK